MLSSDPSISIPGLEELLLLFVDSSEEVPAGLRLRQALQV